MKLGINGLGRIGKLFLWRNIAGKHECFNGIVVNLGRKVGNSMDDIAHYVERDSTYNRLHTYLYGQSASPVITDINEHDGTMKIDGIEVSFLRTTRNPAEINWREHDVRLVIDTTGRFLDPAVPADEPGGSLRGHLEAGAETVIISAPFKIKRKAQPMPEDAITTVMGINDNLYNPRLHRIISNASCTTSCLAHVIKPLLNYFGAKKILSASMATVHAATASQQVLDRLPKAGAADLRKSRSVANNIILTSTGAANTLSLVIPEMETIGFIAESVRVPVSSGSLVILTVNFQEEISGQAIRRELLNDIYRQAAKEDPRGYLYYTDKQNVSGDIVGYPRAAAVIEGHETHTRTAEIAIDLHKIAELQGEIFRLNLKDSLLRVPITQAVIYAWYDNEMASYVNLLYDRTISIAENF